MASGQEHAPRPVLHVLREVAAASRLAPLVKPPVGKDAAKGWEVISAVVDSGASITALHPKDGEAYEVEESEASKNEVIYETAGGDGLKDLDQKRMAVLTPEGTLRGTRRESPT